MSLDPQTPKAATVTGPRFARSALFASTGFNPMLRGPQISLAPETDAAPAATDSGPISVDDAVQTLLTASDEDLAPEDGDDPDEEADPEDETEAEDQSAAEDDAPEDEPASEDAEDEDEEQEPDPEPAIDAPRFWSAEEKALFAKAPTELQHLVAAKDAEAEKRVYQAKEEAAAARKDASIIAEVRTVIDQQVERAQTIFQSKWDGIDWARWAREDVAEYAAAKEEFEAEQLELRKMQTAQAATAGEEHRQFLLAENAKLAEVAPDLADPVHGRTRKAALIEHLRSRGYTDEDLKWAGAKELDDAYCAMQWRQAKAKAKADPPKLKQPEPAKVAPQKSAGPVRPAAAAPPRKSVIQRQRTETVGKALKSGRMDDAVAALLVLEGKK
jgi:hypothetical protein